MALLGPSREASTRASPGHELSLPSLPIPSYENARLSVSLAAQHVLQSSSQLSLQQPQSEPRENSTPTGATHSPSVIAEGEGI